MVTAFSRLTFHHHHPCLLLAHMQALASINRGAGCLPRQVQEGRLLGRAPVLSRTGRAALPGAMPRESPWHCPGRFWPFREAPAGPGTVLSLLMEPRASWPTWCWPQCLLPAFLAPRGLSLQRPSCARMCPIQAWMGARCPAEGTGQRRRRIRMVNIQSSFFPSLDTWLSAIYLSERSNGCCYCPHFTGEEVEL